LHWINGGFVSPSAFARFGKPLLWTIHDSWAFTGGCHVPGDCVRYEENCGACPRLGSRRSFDLSRIIWRRKHKAWRDLAINLIAPSNWMADCIRRSSLLGERQVHVIPNAIDTRIYQPFDRATARRRLGLPLDHRIILFGAINATADGNKGYDLLQSSLALYTQKHRPGTCLAIFGSKRDPRGGEKLFVAGAPSGGLPVYQLGGFQDDLALALVYSAADVMCVPSRQESFGQTAAEAMACGTPVVAFGATGLLDIVDHKKNGYLARPYDPEDFAAGIDFVLRAPRLGPAARKKVERAFALEQVARRHIELYDSLT
jgi:glycosyltransferase involved in cell wall biosynthesis